MHVLRQREKSRTSSERALGDPHSPPGRKCSQICSPCMETERGVRKAGGDDGRTCWRKALKLNLRLNPL